MISIGVVQSNLTAVLYSCKIQTFSQIVVWIQFYLSKKDSKFNCVFDLPIYRNKTILPRYAVSSDNVMNVW